MQVIVSRTVDDLAEKDGYKRFSPDHTRYHSLIGDELRLYGGNSIANTGRAGILTTGWIES